MLDKEVAAKGSIAGIHTELNKSGRNNHADMV
jgi:hypothetical protein